MLGGEFLDGVGPVVNVRAVSLVVLDVGVGHARERGDRVRPGGELPGDPVVEDHEGGVLVIGGRGAGHGLVGILVGDPLAPWPTRMAPARYMVLFGPTQLVRAPRIT